MTRQNTLLVSMCLGMAMLFALPQAALAGSVTAGTHTRSMKRSAQGVQKAQERALKKQQRRQQAAERKLQRREKSALEQRGRGTSRTKSAAQVQSLRGQRMWGASARR